MTTLPGVRFALLMAFLLAAGCSSALRREVGANGNPLLPSIQVYTEAERVNFVLQITNVDTVPVTLEFASGQSFEFLVTDEETREVWRWSADQMFTQAEREVVLAAGESVRYEGQWDPPTDLRGSFVAVGRLTARNHRAEQATRFDLR